MYIFSIFLLKEGENDKQILPVNFLKFGCMLTTEQGKTALFSSPHHLSLLFQWSPEDELILSKLTFIGSGASLCALVVTLMLFTVLE